MSQTRTFHFSVVIIICGIILLNGVFPPTILVLSSQAEIDDFAANYPGYQSIENGIAIIDSLHLGDAVDITNLDGLIQIRSIGGDLEIRNNPLLSNLRGLDSMTSIGSNL